MAMENHRLKLYFLLKMVLFQPVMLVFRGVLVRKPPIALLHWDSSSPLGPGSCEDGSS